MMKPPPSDGEKGIWICASENCRMDFKTAMELLVHQYTNGHLNNYCCICNRSYGQRTNFRRHVRSKHLQENFTCSRCPSQPTFARSDSFHNHQLKLHGMVLCELCKAGFTSVKLMNEHKAMVHYLQKF